MPLWSAWMGGVVKAAKNVLIWREFSKIVYETTSENRHAGYAKGEVLDLVGIAV